MVRDPNKDESYFSDQVDFYDKVIREDMPNTESFPRVEGRPIMAYGLVNYCLNGLFNRYSRGDHIESIRPSLMLWIEAKEIEQRVWKSRPAELNKRRSDYQKVLLATVYDALTMLAFGAALKFKPDDMHRLIAAIGYPGEDALMDLSSKALGDTHRPVAGECKYPKVYAPLLDVWLAPAGQRATLLAAFAKQWKRKIRPIYWSNSLKGAEGAYFGYWCFDIALTVIVLNIDDMQLRDNPYYPADLVDYARGV